MLYDDARSLIKSGDLIAFAGKGSTGSIIRAWTGASYSHVGIACWFDIDGVGKRLALIESMEGKGVTIRALSKAGSFYWISHPGQWGTEPFEFAWDKTGVASYDWTSILMSVLGRAPVRDDSYICSEMAGEILALQGLPIDPDAFGDPGQLVDAALECGGAVVKVLHRADLAADICSFVDAHTRLTRSSSSA